jgi:folate-dependent phosphoribosylglycinamide formyltransferase PurN
VLEGDTPETLAERVREVEAAFFVDMLRAIGAGEVQLDAFSPEGLRTASGWPT